MVESIHGECGSVGDEDRPDYMNERVFQRNRLPPRAYFLPAEHLSLSGKWRFHYALSPLEPEPEPGDDGAWALIDVPGKLVPSSGKVSYNCLLASAKAHNSLLLSLLPRRMSSKNR